MSVVFFQGSQSGRGDLSLFVENASGEAFDPAAVTYDVFSVPATGDPVQMLPASRVPQHPAVGEFYALETFLSATTPVGTYRIRWRVQKDPDGPEQAISPLEFAVVARS